MKIIYKKLTCLLAGMFLILSAPLCGAEEFITLASTTSTQASGFFDYYLPIFQKETRIEVRVVAVGTGQALKLGENGDADVLLVHDKAGELKFIEAGFGVDRREVMFNDFVFIGPEEDPAEIEGQEDAVSDLKRIAESKSEFISRGDDSGTNRLELRLWKEAGIDPKSGAGVWYKEAGAGMGEILNMLAAGGKSYTISDRATWISFENRKGLALLDEGDLRLFNQYSLILVSPERHSHVKKEQGLKFMDWMTSPAGQQAIGDFKLHDQVLFTPNFKGNPE
ncbi:MAG: substrate-binding domain-containing protein [Methylococcaceae bacterium]|nr:substrate-binding domain-containing protein [Methylococcaceae bacterium]